MRLLLVLLFCISNVIFAKDSTTKLLQPLPISEMEIQQSVEAEVEPLLSRKDARGTKLIGKSITTTGKQGQIITQFAFGGVEKIAPRKKGKRQVVLLEKPAVGAVITEHPTAITREDSIPLQYEESQLSRAVDDLLAGRNLAKEPKKFTAHNPTGETSAVEKDKSSSKLKGSTALSSGLAAANETRTKNTSTNSVDSRLIDSLSQEGSTASKEELARAEQIEQQQRGVQLQQQNGRGVAAAGRDGQPLPGNAHRAIEGAQQHNHGEQDPARREAANPTTLASTRDPGLGRAGDHDTGRESGLGSTPMLGTRRGDLQDRDGQRDPDPHSTTREPGASSTATRAPLPRIDIRTTCDGCEPRVDRVHNKVIIQEKTQRLEDNVVVHTGPCEDTLDQYDIYKDFLCDGCDVHIDNVRRAGFDTYKGFWIDGGGQRHVLDDAPQIDVSEPHPFLDDPTDCGFEIDEVAGMAYTKVATVFSDRFNGKHVVEACHRKPDTAGFRLIEQDCPIEHDFAGRRSFLRKKLVFNVEGVEHEARACARAGDPLPHEFVTDVCQPIVDPHTGAVTPLARRRIRTPSGNQYITECEPLADTNLQATTEGCEDNLFSHDFTTGRSYYNKRYYYMNQSDERVYCTGCVRSSDSVAHESEPAGYQHDDVGHRSFRKLAIYITFRLLNIPQPRLRISDGEVRPGTEPTVHTLVRTENRVQGTPQYQGCHRITQTQVIQHYRRPDDSTYEIVAGLGVPIQGPNECRFDVQIQVMQSYLGSDGGEDQFRRTMTANTYKIYPGSGRRELVNSFSGIPAYEFYNHDAAYKYTCSVTGITKYYMFNFNGWSATTATVWFLN